MRKKDIRSVAQLAPKDIELGFCTINQKNTHDFILQNPKREVVNFRFDSKTFQILPSQGQIEPKQQIKLQIQWIPNEAEVIVSTAILYVKDEDPITIKISGVGKYPYLELNQKKIDFESLLLGKQLSKELIIKNQSQVRANFTISKISDHEYQDNSFTIEQNQGQLEPNQSFLINIEYCPTICHVTSVSHFEINTVGGNTMQFQCIGHAIPFNVFLSVNSINYQEVYTNLVRIGQMISRMFTINNPQDISAKFEFYNQPGNVYSFSKTKGTIPAKSNIRIIVYFNPIYPVNYYQRVYCLIRNHQVLYIDLIGTGYDLLMKPLNLNQTHIDLFRTRVIEGRLSKLDFKYLENSLVNGPLYSTYKESTKMRKEQPFQESEIALHKELLMSAKSQNKLVSISEESIDFEFQSYMQCSNYREIILTNKLPVSLQIFWTLQKDDVDSYDEKQIIFNVNPSQAILKGNESIKFEINFRPTKNSFYFFQNLQFFAVKMDSRSTKQIVEKSRTFSHFMPKSGTLKTQNVIMDEMVPSIEGSIFCVGHSFPEGTQPFIPIMSIKPSNRVYFKPCSMGECVYQTLEFINQTDTPAYFKFNADLEQCIKIFPKQGVVEAKSFCLLLLEFSPNKEGQYQNNLCASLNHSLSNQITINCQAYCCGPSLKIANQGKIFFPPSFIGVVSKQSIKMKNTSKIECEYQILIPDNYKDEVYIEPTQGILKAQESKSVEFNFNPLKNKKYKINIPIQLKQILSDQIYGYFNPGSIYATTQQQVKKIEHKFEIIGQGSDGDLTFYPQSINFDDVKINFNKKVYFTIKNQSNCMFNVQLLLKSNDKKQQQLSSWFDLDFQEGIIAANSQIDIGITFSPTEVCDLHVDLICYTKDRSVKGQYTQSSQQFVQQKFKIPVKAKGSYPLLKIVDVRNDSISVATLWENMQINFINKQLSNYLNDDEKKYLIIETLNYQEANSLMKNLKTYQWNFGCLPAQANIKPRVIIITIQNVGGTDLDWNFKLPSDSQIDVEPWADPGEPTDEEAFEKFIIEKRIFEINPKKGYLKPGELADIQIIYNPQNQEDDQGNSEAVKHHLQVVLEILNGKPVVIQLKGMTVAMMKGKISIKKGMITLRKNKFVLPDVPIGLMMPVTFPIEINNVGSGNVTYKVTTKEITDKQRHQSTNFKIFDIKNQQGSLNPGEKQYLYCLLRPLEQKVYDFQCNIAVFDHQNQIDNIEINVQYRGFFKNIQQQISNQESLPSARSQVSTIGSKVFFSMEEIDFGEINVNDSEYRILILYNLSQTTKLSFSFKNTGLVCGDELILEPIQGNILPGQFIEIKLTLIPNIIPSIYEGEIECKIQWQTSSENKENLHNDETLFLRIKKTSDLKNLKNSTVPVYEQLEQDEEKSPINKIFSQIIEDVLNGQEIQEYIDKADNQNIGLYDQIDQEIYQDEELNINQLQNFRAQLPQNKNRKQMFLNDEFNTLLDNLYENTFFNMIQECTRKEADLLRVSKTFITPNTK